MKPVVTRLYVLLVVLTLVGLAAWAAADWYQLRQGAVDGGRAALRETAGLIADLSLRPVPTQPADLAQAVARGTKADPRWKVLILSGSAGTEFYRGPRPPVPVDQAVPRWAPQEGSEVVLALPVFRANGTPLVLEGIYEFYGRAEVFSLLKACGVTLVVLLVLTIVVVFWSATRADDPLPEPALEPEAPEPEASDPVAPSFDIPDIDVPDDEYWFEEESTLDDLPPLEPLEPLNEAPSAPEATVPEPSAVQTPSLFSPTTGLGWGEFLDTRLSQELVRASGINQDLGLILFAFRDGQPDPAAWGQAVREAFPSIDLDFDYENGAAVVLPGQSLDQALRVARAFVDNLERKWGIQVHAGVAARSGRLVSGSTLLSEAASARRRTLAGTVRVLGLKTDPDRWREHLAGEAS